MEDHQADCVLFCNVVVVDLYYEVKMIIKIFNWEQPGVKMVWKRTTFKLVFRKVAVENCFLGCAL